MNTLISRSSSFRIQTKKQFHRGITPLLNRNPITGFITDHERIFMVFFLLFISISLKAQNEIQASYTTVIRPVATETVAGITAREKNFPKAKLRKEIELEEPDRKNLPQNPLSKPVGSYPWIRCKYRFAGSGCRFNRTKKIIRGQVHHTINKSC